MATTTGLGILAPENAEKRAGHFAPYLFETRLIDTRGGDVGAEPVNRQHAEREQDACAQLGHLEHVLDGV